MKKLSKKQKLIGFIAILLVTVIIAIVITTSIVNNNQVANEGYATTSANAGSSLISNYILNGITIGGITGKVDVVDTNDATATAEDIAAGKVAYARGERIVGTMGSALETESYVGNYADINDDGTVDGVIFADLAGEEESGEWGINGYGRYTIPSETNLKQYYIKGEYTDEHFGTGKVIAPIEGNDDSKNDRFYVMKLDDFTIENDIAFSWYNNAIGLDNILSPSTNDFGDGKTNTTTMVSKWNSTAYGAQNARDMWGTIQDEVGKGWFVPSKSEWAAFGAAFEITGGNYITFGLRGGYWSSSQYSTGGAYYAGIDYGNIYYYGVIGNFYVRLATTF